MMMMMIMMIMMLMTMVTKISIFPHFTVMVPNGLLDKTLYRLIVSVNISKYRIEACALIRTNMEFGSINKMKIEIFKEQSTY